MMRQCDHNNVAFPCLAAFALPAFPVVKPAELQSACLQEQRPRTCGLAPLAQDSSEKKSPEIIRPHQARPRQDRWLSCPPCRLPVSLPLSPFALCSFLSTSCCVSFSCPDSCFTAYGVPRLVLFTLKVLHSCRLSSCIIRLVPSFAQYIPNLPTHTSQSI